MYLDAVRADSAALAAVARRGLDAPVEHCPGWTVRSVVEHVGMAHLWVDTMVRARASERLRFRELPPPPSADGELVDWFEAGAARLTDTLAGVAPDEPVWNWSRRPHVVAFWPRRMAYETAVHRWDAERGHGVEGPIAAALAGDGIDEVFDTVAPRLLEGLPDFELGGTLHLHATDDEGEGEWAVEHRDGSFHVRHEHAKGDVAARGTGSDLLLFLWGRPTRERLEVFGDVGVLDRWKEMTF